jgi:hypothetical protein
MKWMLVAMLFAGVCLPACAQTTLTNLDDLNICDQNPNPPDPYGIPYCYNQNLAEWAWGSNWNGAKVGCDQGCQVTGNMSQGCVYCTDGQSLQMNFINPGGTIEATCAANLNCYSDVQFTNRLYMDDTASGAEYLTTDLWATTDSTGNQYNENLEFSLEQDVTDPSPGSSDQYVCGLNCNNLDNGSVWQVWWGDHVNSDYTLGTWWPATDGGQTIPCDPFTPAYFDHFIFHFQQVNNCCCTACTKYIDFTRVETTSQGTNTFYYPLDSDMIFGSLTKTAGWGAGLITAMQLDGDYADHQYSVWADKWTVCYAPPGPTNPCS